MAKVNLKPDEISRLRELTGCLLDRKYLFLGFSLDLNTAELDDLLSRDIDVSASEVEILSILLSHYTQAVKTSRTGKLIKFQNLPGGNAYSGAFIHRAVEPIEEVFGEKPTWFAEAAKAIGGKSLDLGDASVEIQALESLPITYILWTANEFAASATVLFDESASSFLPTEDLAVLAQLTTYRLIKANEKLKGKRI